jgi:uncharacterized membrane protein YjjP (DUF1212 family)
MSTESPVTEFLALLTKEWVAYGSEGVSLRSEIQEIARAHGARAEIQVQADSAVLTVDEGHAVQTITVVSDQQITRLDRFTDLRGVMVRAKNGDADLEGLSREVVAIAKSPRIYPEWAKALGIVLFTIGFSVNVQATWAEVGFAALTGAAVALIVTVADRVERVSLLAAFIAAVAVSAIVLMIFNSADVDGGPILLMIPALFFFIPGDVLSASMFELAAGRITAGATQLVYSVFLLMLLLVGVLVGTALTGTDRSVLFAEAVPAEFPDVVPWLGWVLFAFGFMLAFSVRLRDFGWVLLVTLVAFGVQQGTTALFGEIVGAFLASTAMIVTAIWVSRDPARPPVVVLALCGFFVLTVGALGLEGFTALASGQPVVGSTDHLSMLTIAMAIALGLLTGAILVNRATR